MMPISSWIFVFALLVVVPAIFLYILLGPWRALKRQRRDIRINGKAAVGTVVAIDEISSAGRYGSRFAVTVEFTPPDYPEPVRSEINFGSSEANKLGVYQQAPIHYREQMPSEVVIDEFVR
jgi:hypothetical protein